MTVVEKIKREQVEYGEWLEAEIENTAHEPDQKEKKK